MNEEEVCRQLEARIRAEYEFVWNRPPPTAEEIERNREELLSRFEPDEREAIERFRERARDHPRMSWRTPEVLEMCTARRTAEILPFLLKVRGELGSTGDMTDEEYHKASLAASEASIASSLGRLETLVIGETDAYRRDTRQRLLEVFREGQREIAAANQEGRAPDAEKLAGGIREFTKWFRNRQKTDER